MFRFLFKFVVLPILLLVVLAMGAVAYLLLTPISENSVKERIWQACMIGAAARSVHDLGERTPRAVFSSAQCDCAAETLVSSMGAPAAARGAESVRALLETGARRWFSGGDYRELQRSQTGQAAEAFVMYASRTAQSCSNPVQ